MTLRRASAIVLLAVVGWLAPACGSDGPSSDAATLRVEATVYPLADAARKVGGDAVEVRTLTPAGAEPHDMELTPAQVDRIEDADVVFYIGEGFQPAVEQAISRSDAMTVDVLDGLRDIRRHEHEVDPHVWLDPVVFSRVVDRIEKALAEALPDDGTQIASRAATYRAALSELDEEFASGLEACSRRTIVAAHDAFGYLGARYDLEVVAIAGLEPESEPDADRLAQLTDLIRREGATTVFYETSTAPEVAEALAREADVRAAVLDPIEGGPAERGTDKDYFSVMRENLTALTLALGCA